LRAQPISVPMSETLLWVVGGGGLFGSHLRRTLVQHVPRARLWECTPAHFSWTDPTVLAEELSHAVTTFAEAVRQQGDSWALLWCAGMGVASSSAVVLKPEWSTWVRLLDLIAKHLIEPSRDFPGSIFLASSAGGVYGGSPCPLVTETTPPRPVS